MGEPARLDRAAAAQLGDRLRRQPRRRDRDRRLVFAGKQYEFGNGAVGEQALAIAATKTGSASSRRSRSASLCNALVCLAVWLCYSARTTADKILAIVPPIAAFVAAGFEHSVANMYFIPIGLLVKSDDGFVAAAPGRPTSRT